MNGSQRVLLLVIILATINDGIATNTDKGLRNGIEEKVKNLLALIARSPLVDPYIINNVTLDVNTGGTKLSGFIDGVIEGIPATKLEKNKFSLIGMKHTVGLLFPNLVARGKYALEGVVAGILILDAGGDFEIELGNLDATIVVYLDYDNGSYLVKNVTADLQPGSFHVQIENILGELSDAFNDMVNEIAPEVFQAYKSQIDLLVGGLLNNLLNGLISGGGGGGVELDQGQLDEVVAKVVRFAFNTIIDSL